MAQFANNNAESETTKLSPMFANRGYHLRMEFSPPRPPPLGASTIIQAQNHLGNGFVSKMQDVIAFARLAMQEAQANYERFANKHRSPAPAYRIGDRVWLDTRNLKTKRPMKKLDNKWIGPYTVAQVINPIAYKLELPTGWLNHDVFHTSLL